jgi:hypothetical protein
MVDGPCGLERAPPEIGHARVSPRMAGIVTGSAGKPRPEGLDHAADAFAFRDLSMTMVRLSGQVNRLGRGTAHVRLSRNATFITST